VSLSVGVALGAALVLSQARVLTMDPARPSASTLAIVDDRIAYVGDDLAEARRAAGPDALLLDCGGRTVMPGFNDAHVHFGLSQTLGSTHGLDLPDLPRRDFIARVKEASRRLPDREFLYVKTRSLPDGLRTASRLDFLDRPLFVVSAHGGLLNTAGLKRAGLSATDAPQGFVRGRALAYALERLAKSRPLPRRLEGARALLARFAAVGITSVQLFDEDPEVFEELRRRGELTVRVRMIPLGFRFDTRLYQPSWRGPEPDWVRVEGVKYFHDDGARLPRSELQSLFDVHVPVGRQIVVHVLSRRALETLLDAVEKMAAAIGRPEATRLFRVEHADEVTPREAARLARAGIPVCANPSMIPEWRSASAFPLRTLVESGVSLCIGTDWVGAHDPPRALEPFESVELAVTHGGFLRGQDERLPIADVLRAYTVGSARAEGMGDRKGSLAPGLLADLLVLSADPLTTPAAELASIRPLVTVVGGRIVWRSESLPLFDPRVSPPTLGPPPAPSPPTLRPAPGNTP
jgi:predicted amidohydrolase YtcJ